MGDHGFGIHAVEFNVFVSQTSGAQHMGQEFRGEIRTRAVGVESSDVQKVLEVLSVSNDAQGKGMSACRSKLTLQDSILFFSRKLHYNKYKPRFIHYVYLIFTRHYVSL